MTIMFQQKFVTPSIHSLYVHVPFCEKKCFYCDFASIGANKEVVAQKVDVYCNRLFEQVTSYQELGLLSDLQTVYIGGGTPTFIGEKLSCLCKKISSGRQLQEFSCEGNPESVTRELLESLKVAGVSRISLGVQSLQQNELTALGRIHTPDKALEALSLAKDLNFDVSADVMCAIPHQSADSFVDTLHKLLALKPDHISCYPLQIEEGTVFGHYVESGKMLLPSEDKQAQCMKLAQDLLYQAGYHRYEVASYAQAHKECQHNIAYWTGKIYLGLGLKASSMFNRSCYERYCEHHWTLPNMPTNTVRIRLTNTDNLASYLTKNLNQLSFEGEFMSLEQALAEDLMLACRMTEGINQDLQQQAEEVFGVSVWNSAKNTLIKNQLLKFSKVGNLIPTEKGWLLGNELFEELWSLALEAPQTFSI